MRRTGLNKGFGVLVGCNKLRARNLLKLHASSSFRLISSSQGNADPNVTLDTVERDGDESSRGEDGPLGTDLQSVDDCSRGTVSSLALLNVVS